MLGKLDMLRSSSLYDVNNKLRIDSGQCCQFVPTKPLHTYMYAINQSSQ